MGCCYLGMEAGSTTVNGNSSSNSSSCWLGQAQEDEGLELVVAVEVASLALTLGLARFIHRNVETEHPVYAVLYQNSILLSTVQSACLSLLLSAMLFEGLLLEAKASCSPLRMWAVFEPILAAVSAVLNSAHWLVVNALRYYFIVKLKSGGAAEPDFSFLRWRSLAAVWAVVLAHVGLCLAWWMALFRYFGFPEVRYGQLSPGQQVAVLVLLKACLDLPDVASICVYLAIRRHLTAAVQPQPQPPIIDNASAAAAEEPPFGGIYVGDNEVEDGGSSTSPPPVQVAGSNKSKEMRAVLLALKSYAASSLFDTAMLVFPRLLLPGSPFKLAVHTTLRQILSMWLPVALTAANFGPLRKEAAAKCGALLSAAAAAVCPTSNNQVGPPPEAAAAVAGN